jgi:hypothetical protein
LALILDPHVREQYAIFDFATEIFDAPASPDRPNHNLLEDYCITDFQVDRDQLTLLDSVYPFVAGKHEWASGTGADEHETRMNEGLQSIEVLRAERVTPIAFQRLY